MTSSRDQPAAKILVTVEVSAEEKQTIVKAFRALDVAAPTWIVPTHREREQTQRLVLTTLPLQVIE